jgi:hypothetical protein
LLSTCPSGSGHAFQALSKMYGPLRVMNPDYEQIDHCEEGEAPRNVQPLSNLSNASFDLLDHVLSDPESAFEPQTSQYVANDGFLNHANKKIQVSNS